MARIRLLHGIHGETTEGVDAELIEWGVVRGRFQ
jgi:hypothetical protein